MIVITYYILYYTSEYYKVYSDFSFHFSLNLSICINDLCLFREFS